MCLRSSNFCNCNKHIPNQARDTAKAKADGRARREGAGKPERVESHRKGGESGYDDNRGCTHLRELDVKSFRREKFKRSFENNRKKKIHPTATNYCPPTIRATISTMIISCVGGKKGKKKSWESWEAGPGKKGRKNFRLFFRAPSLSVLPARRLGQVVRQAPQSLFPTPMQAQNTCTRRRRLAASAASADDGAYPRRYSTSRPKNQAAICHCPSISCRTEAAQSRPRKIIHIPSSIIQACPRQRSPWLSLCEKSARLLADCE
jgi:hypothetical protein